MQVPVNDFHFNMAKVPVELTLGQWLRLKATGETKVFEAMKRGWRNPLPFYVFRCESCGEYGLDYKHGYDERLDCPVCKRLPAKHRVRAEALTEATH